ncbi:SecDF P1 head subdomain-containing protein [Herbaspirillum sp. alder98]|uniref:SecDF P1 head subdomain-containing protein n=1 Tax=Herbaspirillum sp. alder98 TaxID=2913096 RepID=UPI001CD8D12D|nr:preprotein translocase subunit SecD [Herbaspirillum sp. alder98]MCA1324688.1 preprotein translocase subunit SecD [Herbaspirillum sp. alder98]
MSAAILTRAGWRRALAAVAVLAVVAGCASSGDKLSATQPFELRGATTAATEGWIKAGSSDVPGTVVYLAPRAILGAADVERATVQKDAAGRSVLLLQFTPAGTARLTAGTRELVGRQLAAVVEGRVTNIAKVTEPMTINTMALTGFASFDDATRVAHAISARR